MIFNRQSSDRQIQLINNSPGIHYLGLGARNIHKLLSKVQWEPSNKITILTSV